MNELTAINWAIKALKQMKQKIAYDANMAKIGATYPHAMHSLEAFNKINEAIEVLEGMKNGKQSNHNPN